MMDFTICFEDETIRPKGLIIREKEYICLALSFVEYCSFYMGGI